MRRRKPLPPWVRVQARVADDTEAKVRALFARHERGELNRSELVVELAVLLRTSTAVAIALADKYTALELGKLPGGWVPDDDEAADEAVLAEVHAAYPDEVDADHRAAVLSALVVAGRAVTLDALQKGRTMALKGHDVRYWRRSPEAGACEVCEDLADGIVPIAQVMWTHRGCGCGQDPVLPTDNN